MSTTYERFESQDYDRLVELMEAGREVVCTINDALCYVWKEKSGAFRSTHSVIVMTKSLHDFMISCRIVDLTFIDPEPVCEWWDNKVFDKWMPGCMQTSSRGFFEDYKREFCQYCGGKIKEVE